MIQQYRYSILVNGSKTQHRTCVPVRAGELFAASNGTVYKVLNVLHSLESAPMLLVEAAEKKQAPPKKKAPTVLTQPPKRVQTDKQL